MLLIICYITTFLTLQGQNFVTLNNQPTTFLTLQIHSFIIIPRLSSRFSSADAGVKFQHFLMVGVHGESGATVSQGSDDITDVLVEGGSEV